MIINFRSASTLAILGRALCIREVDAGSCNACELEIHALSNPYYNIEGLGIKFVASPRHADMLLVTGPVSKNMAQALRSAYEAVPEPRLVVATGGMCMLRRTVRGQLCKLWPRRQHYPRRCRNTRLSSAAYRNFAGDTVGSIHQEVSQDCKTSRSASTRHRQL